MIKIYYSRRCHSSQRALSWLKKYDLNIQKKKITSISKKDLLNLLQFSDEGLKDILKRPERSGSKVSNSLNYIDSLSLNDALDYIITNPDTLQTPVIIDGKNYLVGYNEYEIRKFLPKEYRRHQIKTE